MSSFLSLCEEAVRQNLNEVQAHEGLEREHLGHEVFEIIADVCRFLVSFPERVLLVECNQSKVRIVHSCLSERKSSCVENKHDDTDGEDVRNHWLVRVAHLNLRSHVALGSDDT